MDNKIFNNRYKLINKIGIGGMAEVYKAVDIRLNRIVAVKVLKNEFIEKDEFIRRFQIEAQSVAALSHTNIVPIFDIGEVGDIHFIIMEYIDGKSLKDLIRSENVLSLDKILNTFIQICKGISHAHENNIIHRDIKPHNILISKNDIVKITDFGIAKIVSQTTMTQVGSFMGSVHYFSPEQANSGKADERSDIYSLGITLYEMITGNLPFNGENFISIVMQQIQKKPDFSHERFKKIPHGFECILKKMLEKEPKNRYQNIKDLMIELYSVVRLDTNKIEGRFKFKEDCEDGSIHNNGDNPNVQKDATATVVSVDEYSETVVLSDSELIIGQNKSNSKIDDQMEEIKDVQDENQIHGGEKSNLNSNHENILSPKGKNDFFNVVKSVIPQVISNSFTPHTQYVNYKDLENYEYIKLYHNNIYAGLSNGFVKVWNLTSGECIKTIQAADFPIKHISIYDNTMATCSTNNGIISMWDLNNGNLIRTLEGHKDVVKSLVHNKDILVSGARNGIVKVWNINNGSIRGSLKAHSFYVKCLLICGKKIISGSSDGMIKFWNSGDGSCEKLFSSSNAKIVSHFDAIDRLVFKNNLLVSATKTGKIRQWNIDTCKCLYEFENDYKSSIENMAIYNNELITVSFDGSISIWDIAQRKCKKTYENRFFVNSVSIAGNKVAAVSKEGIIKIWDIDTGSNTITLNNK